MISTNHYHDRSTVDLNARIGDILVTATVHLEPTGNEEVCRVEREVVVFIGKLRFTRRINTPKHLIRHRAYQVIGGELQRIVDEISWRDE